MSESDHVASTAGRPRRLLTQNRETRDDAAVRSITSAPSARRNRGPDSDDRAA